MPTESQLTRDQLATSMYSIELKEGIYDGTKDTIYCIHPRS